MASYPASHPFSPFTDESPTSPPSADPSASRPSGIHPRTLREKQPSQHHSRIASASTAEADDEKKAASPPFTISSPSSSIPTLTSPIATTATPSIRSSPVLLSHQLSRSRRDSPGLVPSPVASASMEGGLDVAQPELHLPPPLIIRDSPVNAGPTTGISSRPVQSPPSLVSSASPRARPVLGPPQSPHASEDEVNWTRRMQKVETTSSKRSSFIQRQAAATPTPGLVRAHSFSAQTVMAASGAFAALSPSSLTSYVSSPKGSTVKKPARSHHRSMSNVVDWTPYSKRKSRPIAVAPFSQRRSAAPAPTLETPASKGGTMSMTGMPVVGSAAEATTEEEMEDDAGMSWHERLRHWLYLLRTSRTGSRVRVSMHSLPYLTLIGVTTLFSLYAQDFNICWFPPSADTAISVLLTLALGLFSLDIVVNCLLLPGYCLSFFCLVDVIGTVSLMLDIQFMLPLTLNEQGRSASLQHLTQSGNVLRVTRFVRLFRIMQATRIVRLFRGETAAGRGEDKDAHANRVGMQLSELIDKRVISMLLGVIIILPFFTVDDTDYGASQHLGLAVLESIVLSPSQPGSNSTAADTAAFLSAYELYNSNLLYLSFPTSPQAYTPVDILSEQSGLRAHDLDVFSAPQGSTAVFNIESQYAQSSLYTIILTSIIIAMFVLGSLTVSRDVYSLVVAPLERMTSIIKKLAGTICFLTNDQEEPSRASRGHARSVSSLGNASAASQLDAAFSAAANETRVIEGIIEKLATIFQVEPDASMAGPKALQRMAGSKHTEITTSTSVVSIAVVERPRMDVDAADDLTGDVSGSGGGTEREVDTERHRELRTVEDGIASAAVLPHFRLYLTTNLLMENLLFYQEVERYRAILLSHSHSLYSNFISSSSSSQVNISAALHDSIKQSAKEPRASMFDEAQHECVMLMKAHVRGFTESRYCQLYLRKKGRGPANAEVMYKKKRAGGPASGGWTGSPDSVSGSGPSSTAATTMNTTRSTRASVVMHRDKIEEETEGDEQQTAAATVAVVQPKPKRHSTNAVAPAPPVVAVKAVKSKPGKSRAEKVSAMREEDLLAEIEALEHPGAEAAALFAPGKNKAKQQVKPEVKEEKSIATTVAGGAKEELQVREERKQGAEADVAADQPSVGQRVAAEVEVKQGAAQQSQAGAAGAAVVEETAVEAVETDAAGGVVVKATGSEDKVDAEVEEEMARLLSADGNGTRSSLSNVD